MDTKMHTLLFRTIANEEQRMIKLVTNATSIQLGICHWNESMSYEWLSRIRGFRTRHGTKPVYRVTQCSLKSGN